jgi:hypothetical protein
MRSLHRWNRTRIDVRKKWQLANSVPFTPRPSRRRSVCGPVGQTGLLIKCQLVLVFILGHGDKYRLRVAMCCEGSAENAPRLARGNFYCAIRTGVGLNLLISWCYPGEWVLNPMLGSSWFPAERLNLSGTKPSSLGISAHSRTIRRPAKN